jgi:medium-chain acyl-[acyl-carrier-protein] hydrolase
MDRLMPSRATPETRPAIVRLEPRPAARARLLCLPYAGGGAAAYRSFAQEAPPWLEVWAVRLPGRESRMAEPPVTEIATVVATLAEELTAAPAFAPTLPYALFGHSMGAATAFELARALRRRGWPDPVQLIVSGRRAPAVPDDRTPVHHLPRDRFLDEVVRLGGFPAAVLAVPDLVDLVLPALRADFAACENYRYTPGEPLPYGITALGGRDDPTTTPGQLVAWHRETTGPFTLRLYAGNHFFPFAPGAGVPADLTADLERVVPGVSDRA